MMPIINFCHTKLLLLVFMVAAGTACRGDRTGSNPFIRGVNLERVRQMPDSLPKTGANILSYFATLPVDEHKRDAGNTTGEITYLSAENLAKAHHGAETYAYEGVDDRDSIRLFAEASKQIDIAARNASEREAAIRANEAEGHALDPVAGTRHPEQHRLKVRCNYYGWHACRTQLSITIVQAIITSYVTLVCAHLVSCYYHDTHMHSLIIQPVTS
jgi:hypothetical protein